MKVTFAGACNRPHFFPWHLDSLAGNRTPFECIYVGSVDFPEELRGRWPFLRYYKAPASLSPAACAAWALSQGDGELLYHAIDDYEWQPGALDRLVECFHAEGDNYRCMVSPEYLCDLGDGQEPRNWTDGLRLVPGKPSSPLLPLDGLITRRFYEELGGCDRRFWAVMHFVDVCARAVLAGGYTMTPDRAQVIERRAPNPAGYRSICDRHFGTDRPLLESFWFAGGTYEAGWPRRCGLEPYTAEDLAAIGESLELASS